VEVLLFDAQGRTVQRSLHATARVQLDVSTLNAGLFTEETCCNLAVFRIVSFAVRTVERRNVQPHIRVEKAVSI
jgi:hypothetical protein